MFAARLTIGPVRVGARRTPPFDRVKAPLGCRVREDLSRSLSRAAEFISSSLARVETVEPARGFGDDAPGSHGRPLMYLGLDLGTSALKALLIDERQRIVGSASAPLAVSRPHPGWSEQRAEEWIGAADAAMAALVAAHPAEMAAVEGIGLSGQMHGATLLGADERPLRPAILWNDTRAHAEAADLDGDPRFREVSGNIVFPGFTAPKLVWVRRHEPEVFDRVRRVLLPKDALRLWLTGEAVSDMSDASGTSWLDVAGRRWSGELLAASGMDAGAMPRLVEGTEVSATLRPELAARWGMRPVPVAGGGGDNAASAVGTGTVRAGSAFVSLGTSGVLFAANDRYRPNAASAVHAFCHALPGTWHQMGVILSAAAALEWFAGIVGRAPAELAAEADDGPPSRVTFLPYLSGERTPHNDAAVRGAFVGLEAETRRAGLARAVLDGIAFALADSLAALRSAGTELTRVTAIGGGSRSAVFLQAIANALALPVDVPKDGDFGAAFGAARLGFVAATGADPFAVATPPETARTIEPQAEHAAATAAAYARFRALYPALRPG
jgi:xylulokinase